MASIRSIKLKSGTAHELTYYINGKRQRDYFPPGIPLNVVQAEKLRIEREILLNKTTAKNLEYPILTKKINLGQFEDWYIAKRETNPDDHVAPSTLKRYRWALRAFACAIGLDYPLFNIKTEHVQQFKTHQLNAGKSLKGINKNLHHLSHPFKLARQSGLITHEIKITKFKVYKSLPDFLMPDELNNLFQHLPAGQVELACHIIKWTGIRRTELIERCHKSDFNLKSGYLTIHGKNQEDRTAPLHPELITYLDQNQYFKYRDPDKPLFTIQPHTLSDGIREAKQRANIKTKGRTHLLRHTLGTALINNGYTMKEVQYILGHKTLYMTNIYTQMIDANIKNKFEKFKY